MDPCHCHRPEVETAEYLHERESQAKSSSSMGVKTIKTFYNDIYTLTLLMRNSRSLIWGHRIRLTL